MSQSNEFWKVLVRASASAARGDSVAAQIALENAFAIARKIEDPETDRRMKVIDKLAAAYQIDLSRNLVLSNIAARPSGVSLVTACRNRNENLFRALPSWLECAEISEVIIVDWTSDDRVTEGLVRNGFDDPRIRVLRVENEPRWVLSYAFNLGFQNATFDRILKVDADIVIDTSFFRQNILKRKCFIAGNWRLAPDDQAFVNGFFFAWHDQLLVLSGFSEYITSYGWDDEELYARLMSHGFSRTDVVADTIYHLPHNDSARTDRQAELNQAPASETLFSDTSFLIRRNRVIANLMPEWNSSSPQVVYSELPQTGAEKVYRRNNASADLVPDTIKDEAFSSAARELLAWRFGAYCFSIPLVRLGEFLRRNSWESIESEDLRALAADYDGDVSEGSSADARQGMETTIISGSSSAPNVSRPKVFIDAQHGLGNRLRAIGSAATIAAATDRELVIIWQSDQHCECQFSDLFEYSGTVLDKSFGADTQELGIDFFNYMEIEDGAAKGAKVVLSDQRDVYLRSAYVLQHPASSWAAENEFLQRLQPAQDVLKLIEQVEFPIDLGVHVRMQGGRAYEHLPWEASVNWSKESHACVAEWREKSHYSNFFKRITKLIEQRGVSNIFVAADLCETYAEFERAFGSNVQFLKREVDDRSVDQLKFALADAIILSKTPRLLGSSWSSFSELAQRLARNSMIVEMSGQDF